MGKRLLYCIAAFLICFSWIASVSVPLELQKLEIFSAATDLVFYLGLTLGFGVLSYSSSKGNSASNVRKSGGRLFTPPKKVRAQGRSLQRGPWTPTTQASFVSSGAGAFAGGALASNYLETVDDSLESPSDFFEDSGAGYTGRDGPPIGSEAYDLEHGTDFSGGHFDSLSNSDIAGDSFASDGFMDINGNGIDDSLEIGAGLDSMSDFDSMSDLDSTSIDDHI